MNERTPRVEAEEALSYEVTQGPFASPRLKAVLAEFGRTAFGRSSACMEFEHFLRQIGAGGKCCLEIGTMNGITAIVLAQFFERVVCVSVDRQKDRPLKYEIVKFLGINNVEFHDVEDNAQKAAVINALDFDFAYSDGDHAHDTREDFDLVKRCGRVLFHEFWPIQPPVFNLVNSLPQNEVTRAQFDCFAYWERSRG